MTLEASLDWSDLKGVLDDQSDVLRDELPEIMKVVAEMLVSEVSDNYDTTGHGTWAPNAPSTIRRKKSSKPMIDKGILSASTEQRSGPTFAEASTGVSYVVYHLEGGEKIPKRNPFELRDEALVEIEEFVLDAIAKAMA